MAFLVNKIKMRASLRIYNTSVTTPHELYCAVQQDFFIFYKANLSSLNPFHYEHAHLHVSFCTVT